MVQACTQSNVNRRSQTDRLLKSSGVPQFSVNGESVVARGPAALLVAVVDDDRAKQSVCHFLYQQAAAVGGCETAGLEKRE